MAPLNRNKQGGLLSARSPVLSTHDKFLCIFILIFEPDCLGANVQA